MKRGILLVSFLSLSLACCNKPAADSKSTENVDIAAEQKPHVLFERVNPSHALSAVFYGTEVSLPNATIKSIQLVNFVEIKDAKTGQSVNYDVESDTRQAADFFFPDVWSPDGAYLVLPLDKRDGFAIFKSDTAIEDIPSHHYADTIRVWRGEARRYWHSFDAWETPAAFDFKGEMEGVGFKFKYDIPMGRLTCFDAGCGAADHAQNAKGDLQPQESR